ncbi:MAG: UvrD-helicase domain-containing protein [Candidatus Izemoplasmatales bacterium]|nr:UvrD-helicase domain-containing protein [Candidatus Izemoplasmatales bacterium]
MKWTDSQHKAIYSSGSNILVSAGAGSGKTAVLSERTIEILKKGINVNKLLILTFTRASASEMKERIRKKIKENNLLEQLKLLDASYITTFDSFSLSVARRYAYLHNISNNINISSDSLVKEVLIKTIDEVIDNYYELNNLEFNELISSFCIKDDRLIRDMITRLYYEVDKMVDNERYLNEYKNEYFNETYYALIKDKYLEVLFDKILNLQENLDELINNSEDEVNDYLNSVKNNIICSKDYNEFKALIPKINLPRKNKSCSDIYSDIKKAVKKDIESIIEFMRFDNLDEMIVEYQKTYNHVSVIIDIIKEVNNKLEFIKKKNRLYTFNDIAKMAIGIIKDNNWVKEELKNEFYEIMIDEYQDTSDIQEEFISLISNDNVYAVGDIKQSIYRFRNANPKIFKMKYDSYNYNKDFSTGLKIDLLENFRSRREVLDAINEIFKQVMSEQIGGADYEDHHQMIYGNKSFDSTHSFNYGLEVIDISSLSDDFPRNVKEIFSIAVDIKSRLHLKHDILEGGSFRKIRPNDFCILIDRSTDFELYKNIFEYMGIPLKIFKEEKLNDGYDYKVLLNLMKFIILIKNKSYSKEFRYLFVSVARSFIFEYKDQEIFDYLNNNGIFTTDIFNTASKISKDINKLSIEQIVQRIVDDFCLYSNVIKIGNVASTFRKVEYLISLAKEFGEVSMGFDEYVNHLDKSIELGIDIRFKMDIGNQDAVSLMTIHSSKGLEFPVCYYSGLNKGFNRSDIKERFIIDLKKTIVIPYFENGLKETVLKDIYKFEYDYEEISEKIRLFYVALTRAKEKIIIIDDLSEEFVDEVTDSHKLRYRNFSDIMKSIYMNLNFTCTVADVTLNNDYQIKNTKDYKNKILGGQIIPVQEIKYDKTKANKTSYSKHINKILSKKETNNINLGLKIHGLLENLDLKNVNLRNIISDMNIEDYLKNILLNFINLEVLKNIQNANIYQEYEFIHDNATGIIDLLLEYDEYIDIIDYKLKNTDNEAYVLQLRGYKEYIVGLTGKPVNIYLYSLLNSNLVLLD